MHCVLSSDQIPIDELLLHIYVGPGYEGINPLLTTRNPNVHHLGTNWSRR